ncbi:MULTISPECIES: sodium:alanine symporter family protein [unclassified Bacillus (in: firmicutes)]|uniref:alanine/glycine:cation symporter family protein n=1 Tax=unclassified Bacillus (in: firmicutes) TaxID=185979 RepID=UPI000BF17974|nr:MULTISPECIES: alanine/glycine:cation symporter family protein [unclassified Bacillus (in: firmicutes)]PEJ58260.1 sodium:alanine symporter family protein [Bacillus sp. AFS002410]PEL12137.1 sodium:alanine symporter family protein [Bacillus sp. AFS017336]
MTELVTVINDYLWAKLIVILLVAIGLFLTAYLGFIQFKFFPEMVRLLADGRNRDKSKKTVSSLQAFMIGMAARIGTGNIAGVATAVALGGPGAVFWMWLMALIGSASAFVESTLAQLYKVKDGSSWRGGPAYYMEKALGNRKLGVIFSILITLSFGLIFNAVQANTIAASINNEFGVNTKTTAIVLGIITALIIFGGVHSVAKFSTVLVPIKAGVYIILALWVMISNFDILPSVFGAIFSEGIFTFKQMFGGVMGAAVLHGIRRGLFSNEAGMGSAPNAAATAEVTHPVKQGFIQALGVIVDTFIICSSTAMIVLVSGVYKTTELTGIPLTQESLRASLGDFAATFVSISVFLFALSTIMGNYYYGESNISFMKHSKKSIYLYRFAVIGMVLFGALYSAELIWSLADIFMGLMVIVNLYAITRLAKVVKALLIDYISQKKQGLDPVFSADQIDNIPGRDQLEAWIDEKKDVKKQVGK